MPPPIPETRRIQLEQAVTDHHRELLRFAALRCGSLLDAEDIVQEVYLRFATTEQPITHTKAWLYRCVANASCDLHRRRKPSEPIPHSLAASDEERTLEQETARLERVLEALPHEQAEVIRLHTFAALRFTEIAEVLECPVSTVKSRFQYGIEKIRTLL